MTNLIVGLSSFLGTNINHSLLQDKEQVFSLSYRPKAENKFYKSLQGLISSGQIRNIYICGSSQTNLDEPDALLDLSKSNIEMPGMICSLVKKYSKGTAIINFGSSWQFNSHGEIDPFNLYAASKSSSEDLFRHYSMEGIKICSLRLYDTYGKGDTRPKIINLIADAIKNDEVLDMSNGQQKMNFVHIKDTVNATRIASNLLHEKFINQLMTFSIKSKDSINLKKIIKIYEIILGRDLSYLFNMGVYPYRSRERFELAEDFDCPDGWAPEIKLHDGLKELIE